MRIKVIKPTVAVENKRLKVCAYVRVSTDSLEQEDSLDNQIAYFEDYIRSNPAWKYVGIYADQGISGFKENRPQFQKMIAVFLADPENKAPIGNPGIVNDRAVPDAGRNKDNITICHSIASALNLHADIPLQKTQLSGHFHIQVQISVVYGF